MKVSELIEALSYYNDNDDITFYFLKNDTLTNCRSILSITKGI